MPDSWSDLVDDPLHHVVLLLVVGFAVASLLGVVWAVVRVGLSILRGQGTFGQVVATWRQRPTTEALRGLVDMPQLQALIASQIALGGTAAPPSQSAADRIAVLEALHADGAITADRLAGLRAEIEAEQPADAPATPRAVTSTPIDFDPMLLPAVARQHVVDAMLQSGVLTTAKHAELTARIAAAET